MKEALFYKKLADDAVKCVLCPHECTIKKANFGICKVRENVKGTLVTNTYNQVSSFCLDPIEKKPLRRYKPHTYILSVGTMGCNFKCGNCQNYHISQLTPPLEELTSTQLLALSDEHKESIGIAFTYNEPTIWYEYVYEVAQKNNKDTILVTNGYINEKPLKQLLPYINAMNIDLKSMNPKFYKDVCKADIEHVKKSIKLAYERTHIELTYLAIPNLNDSQEEMTMLSNWIADIDSNIPLHIIPFRPMYQMSHIIPQTYNTMTMLKSIASKRLQYVF